MGKETTKNNSRCLSQDGGPLCFRVLLSFASAHGAVWYRTPLLAASGGKSQGLLSALQRKEPRAVYSSRATVCFLNMLTLSSELCPFFEKLERNSP